MAAGRDHDRATLLWSAPLVLVVGLLLGPTTGLMAGAAFVVGGLWLSPDLDTRSNALRRWGPLAFLWWPYRRLIPHRSFWSHGPLIGTATRLAVLLGWLTLLKGITGWPNPAALEAASRWLELHPNQGWTLLLALEASLWLHLILDGDPLPAEWARQQRRQRRR